MNHSDEVSAFRALGPAGLHAWLERRGAAASPELDQLCQQKDAHTALLYWFTELPAATREAQRTGKPILSLRLLGKLDEELSCANSRFFRKLLYPDARINQILRERFVLHWQSVREVPVVTLDFGGGKRIQKTITGNSVHLVLDASGQPVDALPGLMKAESFASKLRDAEAMARGDRRELASRHARLAQATPAAPNPPPPPSRAFAASALAMSKHLVEAPLLRALEPLAPAGPAGPAALLALDDRQNHELHARVHRAFAEGAAWGGVEAFVEWIYAELFLMPLADPALGLDIPDPFGNAQASVAQPTLPAQTAAPVPARTARTIRRLASTISRALS